MHRVKNIKFQGSSTSLSPDSRNDSEWILGLLEHEDVSTSVTSINDIEQQPVHAIHKTKWFILHHNRYKQNISPSSPVQKQLRRSSSTSQLDTEQLRDVNYLSLSSKPKWWSRNKLNKPKPVQSSSEKRPKSDPIDIKTGTKITQHHHSHGHVHSLQNLRHKWSSRLNLLKRSLSNRMLLNRKNTNDIVSVE